MPGEVREAVGRVPTGGAEADHRMLSGREMGDRVAQALAEEGR